MVQCGRWAYLSDFLRTIINISYCIISCRTLYVFIVHCAACYAYIGVYIIMLLIVLDWFWYCKWIIGSLSAYRTYLWSHLYCCPLLTVDFYRASYASAVLGVVILSVCLSVCHTRALWLIQRTDRQYFTPHETAIILVFWCQRSQRNSNGVTPNGGAKERWGRLKRRFSTSIPRNSWSSQALST